jgi:hypothetical protein
MRTQTTLSRVLKQFRGLVWSCAQIIESMGNDPTFDAFVLVHQMQQFKERKHPLVVTILDDMAKRAETALSGLWHIYKDQKENWEVEFKRGLDESHSRLFQYNYFREQLPGYRPVATDFRIQIKRIESDATYKFLIDDDTLRYLKQAAREK